MQRVRCSVGGGSGDRCMSGRLTTEREERVRGCSGSVRGAMRSVEQRRGC